MPLNLTMSSATYNASGKFGQSLNGGSGNASGVLPNPPLTVEAWVKAGAQTGTRVATGRVNSLWLGTDSNIAVAKYGAGGTEVSLSSGVNISDSNWHHIALVLTTTGGTFYLDGVNVASSSTTPTAAGFTLGGTTLFGVRNFGSAANYPWQGEVDDVAVRNTAQYTANFTPSASPANDSDANMVAIYHLNGNGTNSSKNYTFIAPDDTAIAYSPYTWNVTSTVAKTINPGAYFKTLFSGNYCALAFDLTGINTPLPQIEYRVDGFGAWISAPVAATVELTIPTDTQNYQKHLLEVVVKSTTETQPRWNTQSTAVVLNNIALGVGETATRPETQADNVIFFGDSITEGVRTVNSTASSDTDRNDATQGWAFKLGQMLGVEFGIVGFGGTGIAKTSGSGSVPSLQVSYNQLWNGQARSFTPEPKLIVINHGTNDSGTIISACTNMLNLLLAACPTAKIAVIQPFNGSRASSWLGAIPACNNPARVQYIDTAGFMQSNTSSDGLHPYGWVNLAVLAPKIYPFLKNMLFPGKRGRVLGG